MSEIERAKRGDPEAFIRLIEEHRGALLRVAHGFFHREEDVADAVQDTILNAWEHLPQLQKNRYFKLWLVRILINNCIRVYRANRSCVSLEEQSEMGSGCEVFGSVEFQGMLASIPEDSRLSPARRRRPRHKRKLERGESNIFFQETSSFLSPDRASGADRAL